MKRTAVQKKEHKGKKSEQIIKKKPIAFVQVLAFLAQNPHTSFQVTEIADELQISRSNASKIVQALQAEQLVIIGKITPRLWRVQFNIQNIQAIGAKISINLGAIYQSGIVQYIQQKWGPPKSIVLFGSVRKGEDGPNSDIDIAIELEKDTELTILDLEAITKEETSVLKETHAQLSKFEKLFQRKFKLHFFHRSKIDTNLFTNIVNGILLWGFLEAKP